MASGKPRQNLWTRRLVKPSVPRLFPIGTGTVPTPANVNHRAVNLGGNPRFWRRQAYVPIWYTFIPDLINGVVALARRHDSRAVGPCRPQARKSRVGVYPQPGLALAPM